MRKALSVEWLKIRPYNTFWVLLGLFVLSMAGLNYLVYAFVFKVKDQSGKQNGDAIIGHPFSYPDVWHTVSYWSGFLLFLPGLIIITLIANEFSFKTHRQNIIDGWTRNQFIGVKMAWVLILTLFSTLLVFLAGLIFGFLGDVAFTVHQLQFVGYFFIEALSYISVAMLFGIVIKRAGLAIGLYFLYIIILKNTISALFDHMTPWKIGDYLPLSINDTLIPFPFIKDLVKAMVQQPPDTAILLVGSVVYLLIYGTVMVWTFNKSDL